MSQWDFCPMLQLLFYFYTSSDSYDYYKNYHDEMQKRVSVKTRKVASNPANIFKRCLKLGIMSRSLEDSTLIETRLPTTPKMPRSGVEIPSIKN